MAINMRKECANCISKRVRKVNGVEELYCSLEMDKYLIDGSKCGSHADNFGYEGLDLSDYEFEYDGYSVDEITEKWINNEDISGEIWDEM